MDQPTTSIIEPQSNTNSNLFNVPLPMPNLITQPQPISISNPHHQLNQPEIPPQNSLPQPQPAHVSNFHHHPIGQPGQGRIGITFRDIQSLPNHKLLGLYGCMYDLYEQDETHKVDLTKIVSTAWNQTSLAYACDCSSMTEVS